MTFGRIVLALALISAAGTSAPAQTGSASQPHWRTLLSQGDLQRHGGKFAVATDFLTRHTGWAVATGKPTQIYRTVDGGKHWERVPLFDGSQHGENFTDVAFADALHGWILGDQSLVRTTDGGESWEPIDHPAGAKWWGNTLLPLGPDAVMVGANDGWVYITTDGGASWRRSQVPKEGSEDVSGLHFLAPNTFLAITSSDYLSPGAIYRSTDGGASWELVLRNPKILFGIDFADERNGVVVGDGVAYRTSDGGGSWQRTVAPGVRQAVRYITPKTVVSVGRNPTVAISRDGGRTWRPIGGAEAAERYYDIDVVDAGWWVAAGGTSGFHRFEDPTFTDAIAGASLPIPAPVEIPGGGVLPAGTYDVTFAHDGDDHVLVLERTGPAPGDSAGVEPPGAETAAEEPACDDPCGAVLPVDVEYALEELGAEEDMRPLRLTLEPTPTGLAIVLDLALRPGRDLTAALAALETPDSHDAEATVAVRDAAQTARKGGGLFGRLRKAASGDVAGAVEGSNPQSIAERARAGKEAARTAPGIYRLTLRHTLALFQPK